MEDFLPRINKALKKYQPTVQTLGILAAVFALFLTWYTTHLTQKSIDLAFEQEFNRRIPVWNWVINDEESTASLVPVSDGVVIQYATAYFSKEVFGKTPEWPLSPPEYNLHLTTFKFHMEQLFIDVHDYDPDFAVVADQNHFPIGLEINYVQHGTVQTIRGIFVIDFGIVRAEYTPTIYLKGVLFDRYITVDEDLQAEIEKITEELREAIRDNSD